MKTGDSGKNKRRVRLPEPQLFEDRVASPPQPIAKVARQVSPPVENELSEGELDFDMLFNPDRVIDTDYQLVHRSDNKSCPKSVKRCQNCSRPFSESDIVVIKTHGVRVSLQQIREGKTQPRTHLFTFFKEMFDES